MAAPAGRPAPVPETGKDAYVDHCKKFIPLMKSHGVISGCECWGDDLPDGKLTDMRKAVAAVEGETVVFGWMVWPDKATRDAGWAKIMEDPTMQSGGTSMPFDGKRMIFGAFEPLVEY